MVKKPPRRRTMRQDKTIAEGGGRQLAPPQAKPPTKGQPPKAAGHLQAQEGSRFAILNEETQAREIQHPVLPGNIQNSNVISTDMEVMETVNLGESSQAWMAKGKNPSFNVGPPQPPLPKSTRPPKLSKSKLDSKKGNRNLGNKNILKDITNEQPKNSFLHYVEKQQEANPNPQIQANSEALTSPSLTDLEAISPLQFSSSPCHHVSLPSPTNLSEDPPGENIMCGSGDDPAILSGSRSPNQQGGDGDPLMGGVEAPNARTHSHDETPQ